MTCTMRVASPTPPCGSVTRYTMLCSPAVLVSSVTTSIGTPSTLTCMPRLTLSAGAVIEAPRSAYISPTCTVAGLFPFINMTGAACPEPVEVDVPALLAVVDALGSDGLVGVSGAPSPLGDVFPAGETPEDES